MLTYHFYLFILITVLLLALLYYVYFTDHRVHPSKSWNNYFQNYGIDPTRIQHDDHVWYYDGLNTCVGFGEFEDSCPYFSNVCAGINKFGSFEQQTEALHTAIKNRGQHPSCPLIYTGTD